MLLLYGWSEIKQQNSYPVEQVKVQEETQSEQEIMPIQQHPEQVAEVVDHTISEEPKQKNEVVEEIIISRYNR